MGRILPLLTKASPQIEIGCHGTEPYYAAIVNVVLNDILTIVFSMFCHSHRVDGFLSGCIFNTSLGQSS